MANIKSAQKKARKDVVRTGKNKSVLSKIDSILNMARKVGYAAGSPELSKAYSTIDKAAKRNVISKQKSARLKSAIS